MPRSAELPVCYYPETPPAKLITPCSPTPRKTLYLSNLDDQSFLRFSIKYLYLYRTSINLDSLRLSLSRVLVDYYPLAGRLRKSQQTDHKLEVDCNGDGAVFAEAFMDLTADEFSEISQCPNRTFRKLLYQVEAPTFLDIPPLVVQVTKLRCGGMILCTAINHALCDGVGASQFLHAWAHLTSTPNSQLPIEPFHSRHVFRPRNPPRVTSAHPTYIRPEPDNKSQTEPDIFQYLESHPLISSSLTFTSSDILRLKRQCAPSLKCTAFEILASHTWRCWIRSISGSGFGSDFGFGPSTKAKLLFSANIRKVLTEPEIPAGFYGNAFVVACAEATVAELVAENLYAGVKLVQQAKSKLTGDYVKSMVDHLEDKNQRVDLFRSFVISSWTKLGLEDLDFGLGRPMQMGNVISYIHCLFLPVAGDANAVRVALSLPESMVGVYERYMTEFCSSNGVMENSETKCKDDRDHQVLSEAVCSI